MLFCFEDIFFTLYMTFKVFMSYMTSYLKALESDGRELLLNRICDDLIEVSFSVLFVFHEEYT